MIQQRKCFEVHGEAIVMKHEDVVDGTQKEESSFEGGGIVETTSESE